ncbi:hypothetical protein [Chelativorans sp.]|uniref:hypothetical protein n=1 Tax=Chelativorans sp. TaxID=2203393 RepID=UPI00281115B8|nr:hypothetical protein [Chelativorans sp.]
MKLDEELEAEIDALLARDDRASVIDTLLSMPHAKAAGDPAWEKLLHARLQERLVRKMREMLDPADQGRDSRSAA